MPKRPRAAVLAAACLAGVLVLPPASGSEVLRVTGKIPISSTSSAKLALAVDPHNDFLYEWSTGLYVLQASTGIQRALLTPRTPGASSRLAYFSGLRRLYAMDQTQLLVFNTITNGLVASHALFGARDFSIEERSGRVYVTEPGRVRVFDGATGTELSGWSVSGLFSAIEVDSVLGRLYLSNASEPEISVYDLSSGRLIARLESPESNSLLASEPTNRRLFAIGSTTGLLHVFDTFSLLLTRAITVPAEASSLEAEAVNRRLYIVDEEGEAVHAYQSASLEEAGLLITGRPVFSLAVNQVTNELYLGGSDVSLYDGNTLLPSTVYRFSSSGPKGVGIDSATNDLFVSTWNVPELYKVSARGTMLARVPAAAGISGVVVNELTRRVYAYNFNVHSVSAFDTDLNLIATIPVGRSPLGIDIDRQRNLIYVTNSDVNASSVSVIDGFSNTVIRTFSTVSRPNGVAVNPSTNRVYVSSGPSRRVNVHDGNNGYALVASLGWGPAFPIAPTIDEQLNRYFVANRDSGSLTAMDGGNNAHLWTIPIGATPLATSLDPETHTIFVSTNGSDEVWAVDGVTGEVLSTASAGNDPWDIEVNPVTHVAYTANYSTGLVTAVSLDVDEPSSSFTTPPGSTLVGAYVLGDQILGTALDDVSGVDRVHLTYSSDRGLGAAQDAQLSCSEATNRKCMWSAYPPLVPGTYLVTARAYDRAGRLQSPPATITLTVV